MRLRERCMRPRKGRSAALHTGSCYCAGAHGVYACTPRAFMAQAGKKSRMARQVRRLRSMGASAQAHLPPKRRGGCSAPNSAPCGSAAIAPGRRGGGSSRRFAAPAPLPSHLCECPSLPRCASCCMSLLGRLLAIYVCYSTASSHAQCMRCGRGDQAPLHHAIKARLYKAAHSATSAQLSLRCQLTTYRPGASSVHAEASMPLKGRVGARARRRRLQRAPHAALGLRRGVRRRVRAPQRRRQHPAQGAATAC